MLESFVAVPLHFAIEFFGFVAMAGGAFIVLTQRSLVPGPAFNRIAASAGMVALSVGQVAHGGSFPGADADGGRLLITLDTLGFALILMGVVGGIQRTGMQAVMGYPLIEPALLIPAVGALFVAAMALAASFRPETAAMRRLALASLMFAIAHFLTSAAPGAVVGDVVNPYSYAAHAAELVGYVALSAWLWVGVRFSVRTRFVATFVALLVAVMLFLSSALTGVISSSIEDEERRRVASQLDFWARNVERTTGLVQLAGQIARDDNVRAAVSARAKRFLRDSARIIEETDTFPVDFAVYMTDGGGLLAAAGQGPFRAGGRGRFRATEMAGSQIVQMTGARVVREVATGRQPVSSSLEGIGGGAVAALAAARIDATSGARPAGVLLLGDFVDALTIGEISEATKSEASLIVAGDVVASSLPRSVVRRDLLTPEIEAALGPQEAIAVRQDFGSHSYFTAFAQLRSEDGVPVAVLALSSPARTAQASREGVTRALFVVAMGVGAIALVLSWLFGRRITSPIQRLTATARRVREGDLTVEASVAGEDEVGQLGETFNEMTASLRRMTSDLRDAARSEKQLRGRIEAIIQSMGDGLVAVDGDKRILAFNRQAEKITGVPVAEAIQAPVEEVLDARGSQGEKVALNIFSLDRGPQSGIFVVSRSGKHIPVSVMSAVLVGDDDVPAGGVAVIRDMAREREIERMKTEFLSNISHELRTPLTPIKGYAQILGRKQVPPDKAKQFINGILEQSVKLERIVQLLVDFAALEAGHMAPRTKAIDVGAIIESVATDWEGRAPRHEVVAKVGSRLPKVRGDERLIRRSLEEVVDNAVKFSPRGGTVTLAAVAPRNGGRKSVQVKVSDQGIGIPEEDIPKIFTDFRQLDGSETRTYGGLGLGLAFVQRIVLAHNGSVQVKSRPDEGTEVTITLPAESRSRRRSSPA